MPILHTTTAPPPEGGFSPRNTPPERRCIPRDPPTEAERGTAEFWRRACDNFEFTLSDVERFLRVAELALREDGGPLDINQREAVRFVLEHALAVIEAGHARMPP
jgi:hypothetical protein